jgi:hypothetical protein
MSAAPLISTLFISALLGFAKPLTRPSHSRASAAAPAVSGADMLVPPSKM